MIVTCPSCSARYKINESKVKGRGAKITCPRCAHRFVFYREGEEPGGKVDDPVAQLDFRTVGITWKARVQGVVMEFTSLGTLLGWLHDGKVDTVDQISYNGRKWLYIEQVPDLSNYFAEIHRKASRGEISLHGEDDDGADDEDDSDAPTTIAGRGSSIAEEISVAVRDAATPRPAEPRSQGSDPDEDEGHSLVDDHGTPIPVIAPKGSHSPHPSPFASKPPPGPDRPALSTGAQKTAGNAPAQPVPPSSAASARPPAPAAPPGPAPASKSVPPRSGASGGAATAGAAATGGVAMLAMGGAVAVVIALVAAVGLYFGGFVGGQSGPDAPGGDDSRAESAAPTPGGQAP